VQTPPVGTSHSEMMEFLGKLIPDSKYFEWELPAKSHQGRELAVVYHPGRSQWKKDRPTVMIFAQQHGNEPSGKEALLMLIHEMYLNGEANKFDRLNLILVPMVNPDGNEAHRRRNSNGADLNRNHVILTEPETQMLHRLFAKYTPEVTLDVHEYGARTWLRQGFIKDFGEQLDCLSNPAIPSQLKQFALTEILAPAIDSTRAKGIKSNRYLITRGGFDYFVRHSTTDINDGRNSFAIQYTLSFILEGKNGFSRSDRIWERAKFQLTMIKSFLSLCNEKSDQIARLVRETRQQYARRIPDSVIIQADYTKKFSRTLKISLIRTRDFHDTTIVLPDYRPEPEPLVVVKRPAAYIIESPNQQLLQLLKNQDIRFTILSARKRYAVEQFEISGRDTLHFESRNTVIPTGSFHRIEKKFNKGDVIIPTDNIRAIQIVQMMEPESLYGLSHYGDYQYLLKNKVYQVVRVVSLKQ